MKLKEIENNKYRLGGKNGIFSKYYFVPSDYRVDKTKKEIHLKTWKLYEKGKENDFLVASDKLFKLIDYIK
jgi:hypothetical protein